jgi:Ca2+-binding EF-hand superfamily protein
MKLINTTALACAAVFASSLAFAAGPLKFEKADANGDGYVDAEEFNASGVKMEFEKLDKDGDGKLNKKEYSVALEEDCA